MFLKSENPFKINIIAEFNFLIFGTKIILIVYN